jgi:hypothetical protein
VQHTAGVMTCNLWNFYDNLMHLLSSTIQRCGIFIWLPPLYHFNVLHQIRYLLCILPLIIPIISLNLQMKFSYTPFSFWILNPEMLRDYVFGLSDKVVTSVVFPYRELLVHWKYRKPMFHHCLFFANFGATLWSRIQGYGSRDEFWFVITMKNRRNEIFGHLQQSCTLKLNIGVPLLVATMLHFVAKIYKLVHACSGIKETISSICWQTIPQRQGVAACPKRMEPGKVRESSVILSSVLVFYQKLFQSITGCSSCWFTSLECSPPSLQNTGLHLFPIVASYHNWNWQKQKWDQQMTTCPS